MRYHLQLSCEIVPIAKAAANTDPNAQNNDKEKNINHIDNVNQVDNVKGIFKTLSDIYDTGFVKTVNW